jgi:hypothetical protein
LWDVRGRQKTTISPSQSLAQAATYSSFIWRLTRSGEIYGATEMVMCRFRRAEWGQWMQPVLRETSRGVDMVVVCARYLYMRFRIAKGWTKRVRSGFGEGEDSAV